MNKKECWRAAELIMSADSFVRIREGLRFRGGKPVLNSRALSRLGARFTRVGDNIWLHGSQEELSSLVDNAHFETLEDVIEFNRSPTANVIEEVELNDLSEINTSEFSATPALAEAGGIVGSTGVAAGPGTSTIVTGVVIGAGIVTIGTTAGILSNRDSGSADSPSTHEDPIVSIPDHRYIGPGNTVDDTEPVDVDDTIAKEHDIAYEKAKTQEDVQEADHHSCGEAANGEIGLGCRRG